MCPLCKIFLNSVIKEEEEEITTITLLLKTKLKKYQKKNKTNQTLSRGDATNKHLGSIKSADGF